jgi:predicted PurR-regulated permease PerM
VLIAAPSTLIPVFISQARSFSSDFLAAVQDVSEVLSRPIIVLGREVHLEQLWIGALDDMTGSLTPATESALAVLETTSVSVIWVLMIFVTAYYLLLDWRKLRVWILNLFPAGERRHVERLIDEIDNIWWAYLRGTLALMLIMAIVFTVIGIAIGLPAAGVIGLLTGFLSMIPEAGPFIAAIIAVIVALLEGSNVLSISNVWFAVLVAVIYTVIMQIKSLWLRPHVMGRFMHMNTGFVFVAIIGAVILQGILGALVILPILATIGLIGRYVRARLLNEEPWPAEEAPAEKPAGPAPVAALEKPRLS